MKLWNNVEVVYGDNEYLVKFKEYNGWIWVNLYEPKFPYRMLNSDCQYMGYHLIGKKQMINNALWKYESYIDSSE